MRVLEAGTKATQMPQLGGLGADCNEVGVSNSDEFQISELNLISNYNIISLLTSASFNQSNTVLFPSFFSFFFKNFLKITYAIAPFSWERASREIHWCC